ncbi:hypothetical protein Acr_00g0014210 [Actinidia rufa]|uniref:Leucine-rich repeat-containing N-terminal plant-type domain-containing protein n=1 Tax=Actinidia rufa TaxID=165716 RepID=A0A7J0DA97_9ERIC|nr:hypothetical protein Acr_00g0014210 [Actinidia rufa]
MTSIKFSIQYLLLVFLFTIKLGSCNGTNLNFSCIDIERKALLIFKQGLTDPSNRLSSWVGDDCCRWEGIRCSPETRHVLKLTLSLIGGHLSRKLGKLCNLKTLALSMNNISSELTEFVDGFSSCANVSLESLELGYNGLVGFLPKSWERLTSLKRLILWDNSFIGSIPQSIGNLTSLNELYLANNQMNGTIPESFGQLSALSTVDMSGNPWNAVITEAQLFNLTSLRELYISSTSPKTTLVFNWTRPVEVHSDAESRDSSLPTLVSRIAFHVKTVQCLLSGVFYLETIKLTSCYNNVINNGCFETEKKALLKFKEGLTDPLGHLSSWVGENCFTWRGVRCNNRTGNVINHKLRNQFPDSYDRNGIDGGLEGEIIPTLLNLKYLTYSDLSMNNFGGIRIPNSLDPSRS